MVAAYGTCRHSRPFRLADSLAKSEVLAPARLLSALLQAGTLLYVLSFLLSWASFCARFECLWH